MSPFEAHLERHEAENAEEHFSPAPYGTWAKVYTRAARCKRIGQPGWCRLWGLRDGPRIVAHASLFDLGESDVVFGHIGIEKAYRGKRLVNVLQAKRFAFLDLHQLTLCGVVAHGNHVSMRGCLRQGFVVVREQEDGTLVARYPQAPNERHSVE